MKRKPTKQKKIFENHISNKELISIICEELMKMKVVQLCQTICNPMDYTVQGILQIRTLESLSLLQRIFSKQGLNPSLLHCRWIFYLLSHKGSPTLSLKAVKISSNINTPTQIHPRNSSFSITKEGEISEYLTWVYWGNIIKQNLLPTQKISPQR